MRFEALRGLPYLNFVLAQVGLILMLDEIIRREGVAIVRGDPYYHGLLALLLGALNRRAVEVRIVVNHDAIYETVGALAHPRLFRWRALERRVARFTLSRADSVVAGSADNREFALQNGARGECLAYIGNWTMINPVHLADPGVREPLGDEFGLEGRPIVLSVTRLERMKHPDDVVASMARAHRRDPRIAGLIVGEGSMREELVELCRSLGVEDHVIFAGGRSQPWVARMMAQSAVVLAPLAGLALVEAALSAVSIVAYDYEWHSELIRSGQEGILVPFGDTGAAAAAICALVEDPELRRRLGRQARARVLEIMRPAELLAHERSHADQLLATAIRNRR